MDVLTFVDGVAAMGGLAAKLKSPKSSLALPNGFWACGAALKDLGAAAGLGAGFGVVKKAAAA